MTEERFKRWLEMDIRYYEEKIKRAKLLKENKDIVIDYIDENFGEVDSKYVKSEYTISALPSSVFTDIGIDKNAFAFEIKFYQMHKEKDRLVVYYSLRDVVSNYLSYDGWKTIIGEAKRTLE